MIKTIYGKPPGDLYKRLKNKFGIDWHNAKISLFVAYGDTVYCSGSITPDLEIHEAVHIKQQLEMDKDLWWDRYIEDKDFRLSQEVEAYKAQLEFARENYGRNKRKQLEKWIYWEMVELYGDMCGSEEEAKKLLQ